MPRIFKNRYGETYLVFQNEDQLNEWLVKKFGTAETLNEVFSCDGYCNAILLFTKEG